MVGGMSQNAPAAGGPTCRQIDTCLVPLGASALGRLALITAEELVRRLDVHVHLISAVASARDVSIRHGQLSEARVGGRQPSVSVVVDRDPAAAVLQTLTKLTNAIACLASRGRYRSRGFRPSVASQVVARAGAPVLVAGPALGRPRGVWWSDADLSLKRFRGGGVVACLDGTTRSLALIDLGAEWAACLGEPLIVVTVTDDAPLIGGVPHFGSMGDLTYFLESMVDRARAKGIEVIARALDDPIGPADGIASYLEEFPAALVVAGAHHQRHTPQSTLRGTTAAIVLRSPSPVLVVP